MGLRSECDGRADFETAEGCVDDPVAPSEASGCFGLVGALRVVEANEKIAQFEIYRTIGDAIGYTRCKPTSVMSVCLYGYVLLYPLIRYPFET